MWETPRSEYLPKECMWMETILKIKVTPVIKG
jgi:hypothetical protein